MATYHIRVQGHLPERYSTWFDDLCITHEPTGATLLTGDLTDQGALFGVLLKIRDLGLPLLGVAEVKDGRLWMIDQQTANPASQSPDKFFGKFFDAHQRETIAAAMARIIPTDDQPGAREAGTLDFVDRYLSGINFIYAKPDGSGFEQLEGKRAAAWQQRIDIVRQKYVEGVKELDRRSQTQFAVNFVQLSAAQQDRILTAMERPSQPTASSQKAVAFDAAQVLVASPPTEPALQQTSAEIQLDFFPLLALHTRQGFYADSIYGGNKNHVGWQLIGFAGPASLAETHAGRYTTLPYFAEKQEAEHGTQA